MRLLPWVNSTPIQNYHNIEISYIIYHGSLYHDMSVYHDIDKSDEITVIM